MKNVDPINLKSNPVQDWFLQLLISELIDDAFVKPGSARLPSVGTPGGSRAPPHFGLVGEDFHLGTRPSPQEGLQAGC